MSRQCCVGCRRAPRSSRAGRPRRRCGSASCAMRAGACAVWQPNVRGRSDRTDPPRPSVRQSVDPVEQVLIEWSDQPAVGPSGRARAEWRSEVTASGEVEVGGDGVRMVRPPPGPRPSRGTSSRNWRRVAWHADTRARVRDHATTGGERRRAPSPPPGSVGAAGRFVSAPSGRDRARRGWSSRGSRVGTAHLRRTADSGRSEAARCAVSPGDLRGRRARGVRSWTGANDVTSETNDRLLR